MDLPWPDRDRQFPLLCNKKVRKVRESFPFLFWRVLGLCRIPSLNCELIWLVGDARFQSRTVHTDTSRVAPFSDGNTERTLWHRRAVVANLHGVWAWNIPVDEYSSWAGASAGFSLRCSSTHPPRMECTLHCRFHLGGLWSWLQCSFQTGCWSELQCVLPRSGSEHEHPRWSRWWHLWRLLKQSSSTWINAWLKYGKGLVAGIFNMFLW